MVGPACTPSTLLASVCLVFGGGFWWDKTHNSTLSGKFNPFQNQLGPGLEEPAQPERVEESEGAPTGQPVPEAHTDSLEEAPAQQRAEQSETAGDARAPVETLATQDASTKDAEQPQSRPAVEAPAPRYVAHRAGDGHQAVEAAPALAQAVEAAHPQSPLAAEAPAPQRAGKGRLASEAAPRRDEAAGAADEAAHPQSPLAAEAPAPQRAGKGRLASEAAPRRDEAAAQQHSRPADDVLPPQRTGGASTPPGGAAAPAHEVAPSEAVADLLEKGQRLVSMLACAMAGWLMGNGWSIFAAICLDLVVILPCLLLRRWRRRPAQPAAEEPRVMETEEVQELVSGKRVLHVKGFGVGFKDPVSAELMAVQQQQDQIAVQAINRFRPDFLVVDGDPFGSGFQRYIKVYVDRQVEAGLAVPKLVWVKSVKGSSPSPEELDRNKKKAREWADQGLHVVVSWLPEAAIAEGVDRLFGEGCWEKLQGHKFDFRGAVRLLEQAEPKRPEWLRGLTDTASGGTMYEAIEAVEGSMCNRYFEKCSFENAAKGNAIYQHLRGEGREPAAQGAVSFGGGESVLLEFATLYLFPGSGFDAGQAALFPFRRGRPGDPALPAHQGHVFRSEKQLSAEDDEEDEDVKAAAGGA